jgi:hypothetical protein
MFPSPDQKERLISYLTYSPREKTERKNRPSIIAFYPRQNYQIDIMDYTRRQFQGYRYILTCIDVYSRLALAEPLKSRRMHDSVIPALEKIFQIMGPPKNINADQEFNNQHARSLFEKYGVQNLYFSQPYEKTHNAIVERFHRTLAGILLKLRFELNTGDWPNILLPKAIEIYNTKFHRTIQARPIDVFLGDDVNKQEIIKEDNPFQVGEIVTGPISQREARFRKGDIIKRKFYYVSDIQGNKIYLKDLKGNEIPGYFRPYQLKKTKPEDYFPIFNQFLETSRSSHWI